MAKGFAVQGGVFLSLYQPMQRRALCCARIFARKKDSFWRYRFR